MYCQVLYSASADILHCSGIASADNVHCECIARYSTEPVQILFTVQVLPGIVQFQCRYFTLDMYYQVFYSASADSVHCTGIARYCTVPLHIVYTVQVLPGIVQCHCRYCSL